MGWLKVQADLLYDEYGLWMAHAIAARNKLYSTGDAIEAEDWGAAKVQLYLSANEFGEAFGHFAGSMPWSYSVKYQLQALFYWIEDNWPGEAELTMDAILSTMLTATPDQVNYFVGIVDAYRQSVWNSPFNQDFFAALARGFEQWP